MRALRMMLAAVLGALLAACAPGSGGTGTGPTFSFSGQGIVGTTSSGGPPLPPPVSPCGGSEVAIRLDVQDGRIALVTPCSSFIYLGDWSTDSQGRVTVVGPLETPALGRTEEVTLLLQFGAGVADTSFVTVKLVDGAGLTVLGPLLLSRAAP